MELIHLGWGWELVTLLAILAIFISTVSFDMIANWEKRKRKDINVLLIGVSLYLLVILLITTKNDISLFAGIGLVTLAVAGHIASTDEFNSDKRPWELWVMAFVSLVGLIGAIIWTYYYTKAGKYVRQKGGELKQKVKDKMAKRRMLRQQQKMKKMKAMADEYEMNSMIPSGDDSYEETAF